MTGPTVSVIIPFFNGSRWIQRALESVYSQTRLPEEVIVVNDGSTREETRFLNNLVTQFGFRVLEQKNRGQSSARNFGVTESKSDFFCLLDQDDYFLPKHIETLLGISNLEDPMFCFSYGDLHRVSESDKLLSASCVNVKNQHPLRSIEVMLRNNMYILPSATLIRKSAFISVGGFDEELQGYEDDDLFLRLFMSGFRNSFTSDAVSAWTVNVESTSFSEAMCRSRFLYFSKLFKIFVLEANQKGKESGKVFSELLFPRFSLNFANDVVSSSLGQDGHFLERVRRLKYFRGLVLREKGIKFFAKIAFLIGTWPLVSLRESTQRFYLLVLLGTLERVGTFGSIVLSEFVRIHSRAKKSIN
jgi:glycosyltransferase involved in cell wall biosynthesis